MPSLVPARLSANAFYLEWGQKLEELKRIQKERDFLTETTKSLCDVLCCDIGLVLEGFEAKKPISHESEMGYRVIFINDKFDALKNSYSEICIGLEISELKNHHYLRGIWSNRISTGMEGQPFVGIDIVIPMRVSNFPNLGMRPTHYILLDDTTSKVDIEIKNVIRKEAEVLRSIQDKFK